MLNVVLGFEERLCVDSCADLMIWRDCGAGPSPSSDVVDIFDGNTGAWSTAKLIVGRGGFSATSLPSQGLALFAGGGGALLRK